MTNFPLRQDEAVALSQRYFGEDFDELRAIHPDMAIGSFCPAVPSAICLIFIFSPDIPQDPLDKITQGLSFYVSNPITGRYLKGEILDKAALLDLFKRSQGK